MFEYLARLDAKHSNLATQRELQNQTGHSVYQWLLVVLKELMN